ncbi:EpsG family protein [Polaromonas sp.]|uniref:EpsG family protein n=1 Tax=Polaromonas sp. TaxID=1869339 RepID=UPI003BB60114
MEYYILAFIFFYIFIFLARQACEYEPIFFIIGIAPLAFLAVFRGNVGTDTSAYLEIIRATSESTELVSIEPLFYGLSAGLMFLFNNEKVVLAVFGVLITLILLAASSKLEKSGTVFGACVIPIFYQAMTMNGVRYGLSFSIVVFATVFFLHGYRKSFFFIALLAGLIHLSGLMLAFLFYIFFVKTIKLQMFFMVLLTGLLLAVFFSDIILTKIPSYMDFKSPSIFSGTSIFLLSLLAIYVLGNLEGVGFYLSFRAFWIIFIVISSFVLSKFSYAGLRFQSLILFLIFLVMQYKIASENIVVKNRNYMILIFIGLLGLGFNFNNYINEEPDGESPFIPFKFVWAEQSDGLN